MCLALAEALCQHACAQDLPDPSQRRSDELQTYDRGAVRRERARVRRDLADSQRDRLEAARDYAAVNSNVALEMNALDKLALVKGRSSSEYLFAALTFKLKQGGKARQEAQEDLDKLCALDPKSYECVQGKARFNLSSPQMKVRLQPFYMHENNDDYEAAVKDINEIFLDAPPLEHELRLRYYNMMGRITGRELEAASGLANMLRELPEDSAMARQVKLLSNSFHAGGLATSALSDIDDPKKAKRAQADLARALQMDPGNSDAAYWREILVSSRYFRMVDQGDAALEKKDFRNAAAAYRKAAEVDPRSPYAYVGLARIFAEQQNEEAFNQAAAAAVGNSGLESASERRRIRQTLNSMRGSFVAEKARAAERAGNHAMAAELFAGALRFDPDNPWLMHSLAGARLDSGDRAGALGCFDQVAGKVRSDPEYAFAKALILDRADLQDEALEVLKPHLGKDASLDDTFARISQERRFDEAGQALDAGDYAQAMALLEGMDGPRPDALRADICYAQRDLAQAANFSRKSLLADPDQPYLRLRLAQILHEQGDDEAAAAEADALAKNLSALSMDNRRALAQLFDDMGHKLTALRLYERSLDAPAARTVTVQTAGGSVTAGAAAASAEQKVFGPWITLREYHRADVDFLHRYRYLMSKALAYAPSGAPESAAKADAASSEAIPEDRYNRAWIMRNAALAARDLGLRDDLSNRWRVALGEYDGKTVAYADDRVYTRALLTPDEEQDWLRESIRANGEREYLRQTVILNEGLSFIRDSGHPGYSDNRGYVNVLNITFPFLDGTAKFQTDRVMLNSGSLSGGAWEDMYGSVFSTGTDDTREHRKTLTTYAIAFDNEALHLDIGTAPKISGGEIKATGISGGASYKFEVGDWTFTPEIFRRAKDNSVLTFFGDRDPLTGRKWGAVKRTGIALSGSYYVDRSSGWWFTAGFEKLTGTDVEDNAQRRALAGYYYHLIDRPNERLTLAPSAMYMGYDKDLSGYTLGQGGYYSPQQYLSFGTALRYMRRRENTSYMVEVSGSVAHSSTDSIARYPLKELLPDISDRDAVSSGESSTSFGFGLRGSIEQRVTSKLVVGGVIEGSKSDDYSPFNVMMYLRYYFSDFNGDLLMPPAGPTPFVDW